jgi:Xaa-Pro aminopeptidase
VLSIASCGKRIHRLRGLFESHSLDAILVTNPKHVYYFSGYLPAWTDHAALLVRESDLVLIAGQEPAQCAANEIRLYPGSLLGSVRQDQMEARAEATGDLLAAIRRVGIEYSTCDVHIRNRISGEVVNIEPEILRQRRRKDDDELMLIRHSLRCVEACYQRARELVQPGLSELDLHAELLKTGTLAAGGPISRFGNDFQCGTPGGAPRDRVAQNGELWILDLGVECQGYNSDACRVFPVGAISAAQQAAWRVVAETLQAAEEMARPGASCRVLFQAAKARLDAHLPGGFSHHLGHGIGLSPHESPYVNPQWDDVFEEGDTFTLEPGVYHPSLRGGVRIENDYLVTARGVERLTNFPIDL